MSGHITDHLIQDKLITYEQLKNALGEQKRSGGTLEDALVALGYVSEFQVALYLGKVFGVPPADIDSVEIAEDILRLVSKELATENLLIPLYIEDSKLAVAMTDPTDILIIDDLGFVTGMDIHALAASERAIREGIEKYYEQGAGGEAHQPEESLSEGESRREDEEVEVAQTSSSAGPEPNASEQAPFKLLVGEQNKRIEGGEQTLPEDGMSNIASSDEQQESMGESMPPSRYYSSTPFATPLPSAAHAPLTDSSLEEGLSIVDSETAEVPDSPPALDGGKRSILIVDGSETAQRVLTVTLENRGYKITVASNAMQAMAKVDEIMPDLILVDVRLPYIDGYQLCKILKGNSLTKHVPIVMLSDRRGFFDRVKRRMAGAGDHIAKPFRPKELFEVVERYVGGND